MESIGLPSTMGMPASAAGCFGELHGLISWPSWTSLAHSERDRNATGTLWKRRVLVGAMEDEEDSSREVDAAGGGDAQPQTHRTPWPPRVSAEVARATSISRAATASDRAKASRAARRATALHMMTPLLYSQRRNFFKFVTSVPRLDASRRATGGRSNLSERKRVVHEARCADADPPKGCLCAVSVPYAVQCL